MAVEAYMNMPVTLRTLKDPEDSARTDIGGVVAEYTETTTTMYVAPGFDGSVPWSAGEETQANRNTPIGSWFGIGRPDVDWQSWQQIVYQGHVLDVIAPPRPIQHPVTLQTSHVELSLREVS